MNPAARRATPRGSAAQAAGLVIRAEREPMDDMGKP